MSMKTAKSLVPACMHGGPHVFRTPVDPIKLGIPVRPDHHPPDGPADGLHQAEQEATVRELLADIN